MVFYIFFQCRYSWFSCSWTSAAGNACGVLYEAASEKMILHDTFIPYTVYIYVYTYNPSEWCIHPHFSYIWWFSCSRYMLLVPCILWAPQVSQVAFFWFVPRRWATFTRPFLKSQKVHLVIATSYDPGRRVSSAFKMNAGSCRWDFLSEGGVLGTRDHWHQLRCIAVEKYHLLYKLLTTLSQSNFHFQVWFHH